MKLSILMAKEKYRMQQLSGNYLSIFELLPKYDPVLEQLINEYERFYGILKFQNTEWSHCSSLSRSWIRDSKKKLHHFIKIYLIRFKICLCKGKNENGETKQFFGLGSDCFSNGTS